MAIAVAHDDSPEGHAALLWAAQEAGLHQTELLVLQVVDRLEPDETEAAAEALRRKVDGQLATAGLNEVPWDLRVIGDAGSPAAALVDLAVEVEAEILVLGSRRRSAVGKFLLGSTLQRIVLDAPMPVFVVKAPQA